MDVTAEQIGAEAAPADKQPVNAHVGGGTVLPAKKSKKKVRKPQSEEEYQFQKHLFTQSGPTINTDTWLYDEQALEDLDKDKKTDRMRMLNACEKAYYDRNYPKCLELIAQAETLFGVHQHPVTTREDLDTKVKKSNRVERHITDLVHIKEKCLHKLELK
ncbi:hypothetical protein PSN45_002615 [Yamadazyma tenuis]|uniref:Uncharacterized protein n=1 Tax=Candida tenuis (strain ATCC 10573 / BCRC 21748 / CBS 615 / JCM 9827 / NBRC 10315 / NRRL Y-1498 / VKM Y-70) TaxID=590646 RepID=G3AZU5_CANTC|nr:uncharacterized protein CANTEDRAFT_102983 [Yamadazyma tenuis ATCC 10573]EGV65241.1 hypothetical protein CANTEDRAFT_102983 [Yamadazyma tenuis ATCC 10573]WEJ95105.1 hypothetical protein PSN45_002615 [Yamadazyma tenuis]